MSEIDIKNIKNIGKNTCAEILSARENAILNPATVSEELKKQLKYENDVTEKELVIHKAFPEARGKKIIEMIFENGNGDVVKDIPIEELPIFEIIKVSLIRNGYVTLSQVATEDYSKLFELRGFGARAINVVIKLIKDITRLSYGVKEKSDEQKKIELIIKLFEGEDVQFNINKLSSEIYENIEANSISLSDLEEHGDRCIEILFKQDNVKNAISEDILYVVSESFNGIDISDLIKRYPIFFSKKYS